ncbi:hypothetical protein [Adhaeretor mobilis]|uniref:Uncharacterized protein n=1 Tax=Adhaeretor mobilis TaxID=1930276 RepID=A0A517MS90_9BACT|nr:hypothetical protein [Adhaeretor mobilis]QDS97745.1 hypothetical protein HG15A2_10120 [Adhaeretor mobilis]
MAKASDKPRAYPKYQAPRQNGQILVVPQWEQLPVEIQKNRERLSQPDLNVFGATLSILREQAHSECFAAAYQHVACYTEIPELSSEAPLVVTGHQPTLMHPGVWLKNFAAGRLAKRVQGTALNLIIDNDLCPAPSFRVPTGTVDSPRVSQVPWDSPMAGVPFEERFVSDRSIWESFGKRATETIRPLVAKPMLETWWPQVLKETAGGLPAGLRLAQARHQTEQEWGLRNLELPQSRVCNTRAFRFFLSGILQDLSHFLAAYNRALSDYRRAHKLRNHAQPLPNLDEDGDWMEAPFWVWTKENPQRHPLYARPQPDCVELTDRQGWRANLPLAGNSEFDIAVEALEALEIAGTKIRSRALTTTLFARVFLADLFIHGIGGGKYDQVTDSLCRDFFGFEPPSYAVISGTLQLPIDHPSGNAVEVRQQRNQLREYKFHGEKHIRASELSEVERESFEKAFNQKRAAIELRKTPENAAERHRIIESANSVMRRLLETRRVEAENCLEQLTGRVRVNRILDSREYAFCLFPQTGLREFLLDFHSSIS